MPEKSRAAGQTGCRGFADCANSALALQLMYEMTGEERCRVAARELADRIVRAMRATKHGVLFIAHVDPPRGAPLNR